MSPYEGSLTSADDLLIATSLSLEIGLENKKQHLSSSTIAVGKIVVTAALQHKSTTVTFIDN